MSHPPTELDRLQRWFQTVIMHPDGIVAGITSGAAREQIDMAADDVGQVIPRSQAQTSIERLAVYGNAYYARLLECLREEFPALSNALGGEVFDAFAFGYLQRYPSRSYTLANLGTNFPRYLEETRPQPENDAGEPEWPDFLIDLARLERAYSEVFDGPGVEGESLLQVDDLLRLSPDEWPAARLVPVPCLRLESFRYPVHEYATAVRRGKHVAEPDNEGDERSAIAPPNAAPTYLAITRREYVVRRYPVSRTQYELLRALVNGASIGEAIAHAVEACAIDDSGFDALAADLKQWFHHWSAAGFFAAVVRGS